MKNATPILALMFICTVAGAQAPGTDPIILNTYKLHKPNGPTMRPLPNGPAISGRDGNYTSPGSDARMARFSAKIMTLDATGETNSAEGVASNSTINSVYDEKRKLCVMDIGSVTQGVDGFDRFGPSGQSAQPVLIRGTVLNICK